MHAFVVEKVKVLKSGKRASLSRNRDISRINSAPYRFANIRLPSLPFCFCSFAMWLLGSGQIGRNRASSGAKSGWIWQHLIARASERGNEKSMWVRRERVSERERGEREERECELFLPASLSNPPFGCWGTNSVGFSASSEFGHPSN